MSNPQSNGIDLREYPLLQNSFSQNSVNQAPEVFEDDEEELDLRQISKVIRRRGWLMLGVGVVVAFLVGSKLMSRPPMYQEKFQLLVQPPGTDMSNPLAGIQSLTAGLNLGKDVSYYDTQIQILLSNKLPPVHSGRCLHYQASFAQGRPLFPIELLELTIWPRLRHARTRRPEGTRRLCRRSSKLSRA